MIGGGDIIFGTWKLSACTLQLLESSQGQERRKTIGTLRASSAGKLLVVDYAADR